MRGSALRALVFAMLWMSLVSGSVSHAAVGGDFKLSDQDGADFSLSDAHGKVVLLFFGYTSCPDICPDTLSRVAAALKQLDTAAHAIQAVFITVDPDRDSATRLKNYLEFFDDRIIGLSGSEREIREVAQRYRVSFRRTDGPAGQGYAMDHTANIYIIDAEGVVARIVPPGLPVSEIVDTVHALLSESAEPADK
ncbi:MAG: SCO family protein [Gammaproteobacteria bacterium]|nr:SCO family protein [Gammaproteobacteria bacterium]